MAVRMCEVCKKMIEPDRAEEYKTTRLCAEHGEEIKKYGGEFRPVGKAEKTSKEKSFKVTIGGIMVELIRNEEAVARLKDDYLDTQ